MKRTKIISLQEGINVAKVIRDSRDSRLDYFISRKRAEELYDQGKIAIDWTNSEGRNYFVYSTQRWNEKTFETIIGDKIE